jgi:hypothetical protein
VEGYNDINIVTGYDIFFILTKYDETNCDQCVTINGKKMTIKTSETGYGKLLKINNEEVPLRIFDFINKTSDFNNEASSDKKITQQINTKNYEILLTYINVNGYIKDNFKFPEGFNIEVKIKLK